MRVVSIGFLMFVVGLPLGACASNAETPYPDAAGSGSAGGTPNGGGGRASGGSRAIADGAGGRGAAGNGASASLGGSSSAGRGDDGGGGVPANTTGGASPANAGRGSGGADSGRGSVGSGGVSAAGRTNTAGMNGAGRASGGTGNGGSAGSGAAGKSGSAGHGASSGVCAAPVASLANRPQLSDSEAAKYTLATYFAKAGAFNALTTDNWDPTPGLGDTSTFTPDYTVAADTSGTHTTVQAALNAVSGSARRYILVKPGTYRGQISYTGSTPVTLYGADADATKVTIVNDKSQQDGTSETLGVKSNAFQIMNLTLSNDFPTPASGTNLQALALKTTGDKIVLQNVRLHGFQDTLQLAALNATTVSRVYVKDSFIEGDTDFIYGNATVVLDNTEVHYLSSRRGSSSGVIMAPSTSVDNAVGFLFLHCSFTADAGAPSGNISLGRSWDTSSTTPTPNGMGVIRESTLGAFVNRTAPWAAAATSGRAYSASGNRFYEYCNSGPGAKP